MKKQGFTLIELLLVITIIVLLMSLLVPAVGSAVQAVKVANAERTVLTIHQAVIDYHKAYGAYPPDRSPDKDMDTSRDGAYPPYQYPDGQADGDLKAAVSSKPIFNDGPNLNACYGGKFLVYFLMGPRGNGWHRPTGTLTTDVNYRNRFITAAWDPPPALSVCLANYPVLQGKPADYDAGKDEYSGHPMAVFVDGFGLAGSNGGTIAYVRARPYAVSVADKWGGRNGGPMWGAMYQDCRSHPSYPGDGRLDDHLVRMLTQCPESLDFALISPGPDRKFGYRVPVMLFNGVYRKGSWANYDTGLIDDIANYPLK